MLASCNKNTIFTSTQEVSKKPKEDITQFSCVMEATDNNNCENESAGNNLVGITDTHVSPSTNIVGLQI